MSYKSRSNYAIGQRVPQEYWDNIFRKEQEDGIESTSGENNADNKSDSVVQGTSGECISETNERKDNNGSER